MINAGGLFARRLKSEWRFQYRVWKMAVDWTVALYIVIPALLVAVYQYVSWWKATPGWAGMLPVGVMLSALYVTTGFGSVRLFVEEADQLFLLRNEAWMSRLKRLGLGYSLFVRIVLSFLTVGVLAPFLMLAHGYDVYRLILLAILAAVTGTNRLLCGRWLALLLPRILGWIANTVAFAITGWLFLTAALPDAPWGWTIGLTVLLAVSTALLARWRLETKGSFYRDVAYEYDQRMKYAALLMGQLVPLPSKIGKRSKPLLFRGSPRLFRKRTPDRVLAETIVKSFYRSGTQIKLYIQLLLACVIGLLLVPVAVKWIFWLGVSCLLAYWTKLFGKEVLGSPFVGLFPWENPDRLKAIARATPLVFVPFAVMAGLAFGWSAYGWETGLLLVPAGWFVGYALGELFNSW
ncbi:ABC transporter permease [Paenibacillus hodogayensis]|uniref:ABC transporter permease n=1 Tax=Paenibacillus hodogayensis TaxID=279208 RepID=A0ABV5W619_9BACL